MAKKKTSKSAKVGKRIDIDSMLSNENIISSNISNEIEDSILNYSLQVIIARAIPDVRDGLKPVQRCILFGGYIDKLWPEGKFQKNAGLSGTVMKYLHPHGSSYPTIASMSQPWTYRYPMIAWHGNNGSIDGDGPAADRYTEGKLNKFSMLMLQDIDKECVDFKDNFAGNMKIPQYLPAVFPNLLCNGGNGIAVGYTTNIPSHNLGEVVDALIYEINNPECDIKELMNYIKGPDMPYGGTLIDDGNIEELYRTGKASLTYRAKYRMEEHDESGNQQLVIYEIPPELNTSKLMEQLYKVCIEDKKIAKIIDIRDESAENKIRIVIELHKTAIPEIIMKELYDKTNLEKRSSYIFRVISNQTPKIINIKEALEYYISHRRSVIDRKYNFLLDKSKTKLHIQEGFVIAYNNIDDIIDIIKNSDNDDIAKTQLMTKYKLSEEQTKAILDRTLRTLTKLNLKNIEDTIENLKVEIANYTDIINNVDKQLIAELEDLKKNYNDERRTNIIKLEDIHTTIEVKNEEMVLYLTNKNKVEYMEKEEFEQVISKSFKIKSDIIIKYLEAKLNDVFIAFLNDGTYIKITFNDILNGILDGKKVINIFTFEENENIIVCMTKNGIVKKSYMKQFKNKNGVFKPFLEFTDDEILKIQMIDETQDIITILSNNGLVHRFFINSFKETAPGGKGLVGMNLKDGDQVVDFIITNNEYSKMVLINKFDDNTYGYKVMDLNEFKPKGRISQGIMGIDFAKKKPGIPLYITVGNDNIEYIESNGKKNTLDLNIDNMPRNAKPKELNKNILILVQ